jgi:GNAT superfamily N-acetyltransferase
MREIRVRPASADERGDLTAILDAAALETDPETIRESVAADRALVAVVDGRVLGGVVAVPAREGVQIDAIAVRPGRRGQGIGRALVEAVCDRHDRVIAELDRKVRPFYEKLGFEIERVGEGRFRGSR